ncbi:hypothetical protein OG604_05490 [Streptomyces sp. NBC_01231]|nr:hypothetical protein OG604_05490 [Streptomyces sp. NBC_01231]
MRTRRNLAAHVGAPLPKANTAPAHVPTDCRPSPERTAAARSGSSGRRCGVSSGDLGGAVGRRLVNAPRY